MVHREGRRMTRPETDPEGHELEDPNSTLAYSQPRDVNEAEILTTASGSGTRIGHDDTNSIPRGSDRDLEKNETMGGDLSKETTDTLRDDSARSLDKNNDDVLARTSTAIHGKDEEGRYIISWNGAQDPDNPKNWPYRTKMINVCVISLMAFLTPLCSSIFAPGLPQVEEDFNVTATVASLSVTVFVIAFGIGPLLLAPLSETIGRKWIYNTCYPIFTAFQVGCALSTSMGMLIGFRICAGLVGSAGIALGGGTISDMFDPRQRAKVVGKYVLGILIGPVLGPVAGGFVTEKLGWRWCFWLVTIVGGVNSLVGIFFLKETYAPVLLRQRAQRMAIELDHPTIAADHDPRSLGRRLRIAVKRPMKILFLQPMVFIMAIYMALIYGTMYLLLTTFSTVWTEQYGFNTGEAGLTYIGLGCGFLLAVLVGIPQIDRIYNKLADRNPAGGKPEYRMPVANIGAVCIPVGLFWYGWSLERKDFWLVPIIGSGIFGLGMILIFNSVQNYYIDAFTRYAASAIAAGSIFRAVVGATFPLFAPYLYSALGYGWGTSVLAFVSMLLMPMPLLIMKYGERVRNRIQINLD